MKKGTDSALNNQGSTSIFTVMTKLAAKHKAINLAQGFPEFDCDQTLLNLVSKHLKAGKNQYAPMSGAPILREALSNKIYKLYNKTINPEKEICVTAGATQALFTSILAFVKPGDEVIIIEPAYDSYKPSILLAGGKPIIYTLSHPEYQIDWNKFESLVSHKTKMIIINTPHNPTGRILSKSDLDSLENIVKDKDIVVLSDEVYEHIVYDNKTHQSILNFPDLYQQSIAVYSFGKTFHATGWKLGYCVGPEHLMNKFKEVHQWNVFSVNSFVQYALAEYLEDEANYRRLSSFFQNKLTHFNNYMEDVPLTALRTQGTYFQLYDYSDISEMDDMTFSKYLTKELGVAVIPLSPFQTENVSQKVVRFCFAKELKTLEIAAERLKKLKKA